MKRVKQASVEFTMPPVWTDAPEGSTREAIIEWATNEWGADYPEYLALFLEGGALMGDPLQSRLNFEFALIRGHARKESK